MFWNQFESLCRERGEKPTPVVKKLGLPAGSVTSWKNGRVPRHETLLKIADYFGVSVDYLLGNPALDLHAFIPDSEEKEPTVTVDPELLSLIDDMTEEELEEMKRYAEFLLSKKK